MKQLGNLKKSTRIAIRNISMNRRFKNLFVISAFVILLLMLPSSVVQASEDTTTNTITVKRLYGNDRYSTSIAISKEGWTQSDYAILATGENYPDALTSAPLAKKYACPILLTSKYSLSSDLLSELKRLHVKEVFILGGSGVISDTITTELSSNNINVTRLSGATRYETSVKVAEKIGTNDEIALTTGEDFADALSISSIASSKNMPILLNPKDRLDSTISNFINSKKIYKSYIVGNKNSISDTVFNQLSNLNPERIDGTDKYDRNLNVVKKFSNEIDYTTVFLATGNDYPDSLSGSALASKTNSPIILVNKFDTSKVKELLKIQKIKNVVVLGGDGAIANNIKDDIVNCLKGKDTIIKSDNSKVVTVNNSKELLENIAPNTTLILKAGAYNLLEPKVLENKYIAYDKVFDGYEIILKNIENLTIEAEKGAEVKLLIDPRYAYVLSFSNCSDLNISDVIAGHSPEKGSCTGGVFKFTDCKNIEIDGSTLFGCGTEGVTLTNVEDFQFKNSTIKECSYGIMTIKDSKNIAFNDSTFNDNQEFDLINISNSDIKFDKCTISNNKILSTYFQYLFNLDISSTVSVSNSTIKDNSVKTLANKDGIINFENINFSGNDFNK